ncbi:DUF6220 domain-containing protein [Micromonospora sp. DR5-3]|uniref:DUF6220 domain-containing protein n=1 Tax=unclassified Micromonospora TaxID=2617518 RepID=UPI0011D494B0|nr:MULTISPECIES: DUF6220 domain-containing protein [unclassified Micromonospora]MCW3816881.1 DUF6220 domain-containing protein [Micromonospora sp. DR5-3]TYC23387.1 hypothetical protein FXF52_15415 [Micromonospora sp. MP36]
MRRAFAGLATLQLLAVVAQFFLAASGAFDTAPNDESFQPHRALGGGIVLITVLVTVVAATARMPGRLIGMSGLVAGLAVLQFVIAAIATALDGTAGGLVFGLHAVNGLAIVAVTGRIIRQARQLARPATSTPTPQAA